MRKIIFEKDYDEIVKRLQVIPKLWNGKDAILEMKTNNFRQWKQMEWIGFYFQYLCEKFLKDIFELQKPRYDRVAFGGFYKIPFDFKAHSINTSSHQIIVNDSNAISLAIEEYGRIGLILALGEVKYNDEERSFQRWHEELKGGLSKYSMERIERGAWSRLRKVEFRLKQITILEITRTLLQKCGSFQENFRNSDGKLRKKKVLLDLEKINKEIVRTIDF